mgnify:CR=1 FL=1
MNDFSLSDIFSITLNPLQVITSLLIALLVGLFIFFIYKKTFGGVMYSRNFNLSLIMLTMVTSLMLMLISNSLAVSMGMVGQRAFHHPLPHGSEGSDRHRVHVLGRGRGHCRRHEVL